MAKMTASRWALAVVGLSMAIPVFVVAAISLLPADLRKTSMEFQTLIGASVALGAAIIAFANVRAQIESTRVLELERREFEIRQLASALIGELTGFVETARRRNMVSYYRANANFVRERGRFEFWDLASSGKHDTVFASIGAGVGLLPRDIPEKVVIAYALIASVFDRMRSAAGGTYNNLDNNSAGNMLELLAGEAEEAIGYAQSVIAALRVVQTGSAPAEVAWGPEPPVMPPRPSGSIVIHPRGRSS